MPKRVECVGEVFGKLTVLKEVDPYRNPSGRMIRLVLCRCECGKVKEMHVQNLRSGQAKSCGCSMGATTHGMRFSSTYVTWQAMKQRCTNPNHDAYKRYGGKGVTVCERWLDPERGFENFLEDMGDRPDGRTLDRIDGKQGYSKANCRWATNQEQYENKRVVRGANGRFT